MVRGPVFRKHWTRSSSCSQLTFLPYLNVLQYLNTQTHSCIRFIILCFFAINLQEGHKRMQDGEKDTIDYFSLKTCLFLQIRFLKYRTQIIAEASLSICDPPANETFVEIVSQSSSFGKPCWTFIFSLALNQKLKI